MTYINFQITFFYEFWEKNVFLINNFSIESENILQRTPLPNLVTWLVQLTLSRAVVFVCLCAQYDCRCKIETLRQKHTGPLLQHWDRPKRGQKGGRIPVSWAIIFIHQQFAFIWPHPRCSRRMHPCMQPCAPQMITLTKIYCRVDMVGVEVATPGKFRKEIYFSMEPSRGARQRRSQLVVKCT